jgi:zinc/manganese transport system substrate-binding protein
MNTLKKMLALIAVAATTAVAAQADEPIRAVATLPHLAAHIREIGGDRVSVVALGRPDQDPHFIQPTPSLMVEANRARLYAEVGLDLELWSEHVIDGARNAQIRVGSPGHVYASERVPALEVPAVISRAQGDVHPRGNPHVWLDPMNGVIEAENIADALKRVDPAGAEAYEKRLVDYRARIQKALFGEELVRMLGADTLTSLARKDALDDFLATKKYKGAPLADKLGGWKKKLLPYRGAKLLAYHREWSYFARQFGMEVVANLEPKPGIPPTPGHLAELEDLAKKTKIAAVVAAPYNNTSLAESFCERTGIPLVVLPTEVIEETKDYIGLMDTIVDRLAATLAKSGGSK